MGVYETSPKSPKTQACDENGKETGNVQLRYWSEIIGGLLSIGLIMIGGLVSSKSREK